MKTAINESVLKQYPIVSTAGHSGAMMITNRRLIIRENGSGFVSQREILIDQIGALNERLQEEKRFDHTGNYIGLFLTGAFIFLTILFSVLMFVVYPGILATFAIMVADAILLGAAAISFIHGLLHLPRTNVEYRGRFYLEIVMKNTNTPAVEVEMGTILNDMDNVYFSADCDTFHNIVEEIGNYIFNIPFTV